MMILFVTYIISLFLSLTQTTETYHVIHVQGSILNKVSRKPLQTGDRLKADDALVFASDKALAVVLSTKKGRYILNRPTNDGDVSAGREAIAIIRDIILNPVERSSLSTRNYTFRRRGIDLKDLFADNTFTLLGRQTKIVLDPAVYPMSAQNYFVCKYNYQEKEVNKKMPFIGDTLIFDVNRMYTVNGKPIRPEAPGETELYYYNIATNSSTFVGSFIPVYIADEILEKELQTLTDVLKSLQTPRPEIEQHLHEHVQSLYGITDKNILTHWVSEHIKNHN
ncbi:hypothetical protein GXP67_17835 [Rhodocytophaga rosea]|uniref:Uncharacterized protein n=1 Tax=Rhodocytophaga rosea TaxID=2704465 RepID=A0A6C0GK11_9BACT|nr:hypothetical protein [Rhodocytophaga rosea]QHT68368.1 hypothetical protein GXP67_17835 [Rhodocytophaga rosea]